MGPARDPVKKGGLSQNRLSQLLILHKHLKTKNKNKETHELDPNIKINFRKTVHGEEKK